MGLLGESLCLLELWSWLGESDLLLSGKGGGFQSQPDDNVGDFLLVLFAEPLDREEATLAEDSGDVDEQFVVVELGFEKLEGHLLEVRVFEGLQEMVGLGQRDHNGVGQGAVLLSDQNFSHSIIN